MTIVGSGRRVAFAGAVAVGVALSLGELLAGIVDGVPSPLLAIAQFLVDIQPAGAKEIVVALFGTADKLAFQVFIILVAVGIGAGLGRLAIRRSDLAALVVAGFAGAGFLASLRDPSVSVPLTIAAAGVEAVVGIMVLRSLMEIAVGPSEAARPALTRPAARPGAVRLRTSSTPDSMPDWSRRSLLRTGGALAVGSVAVGALGRFLLEKQRAPATPVGGIPAPAVPATLPSGADISTTDLSAAGFTPIVMPNPKFYRIDTAFIAPTVDRDSWRLKVTGRVDHEVELTYAELVALPIIEQYVTIACVSNEVGGDLVGNAKWTGVPLRSVLEMAGVQASADQLVGRSVDGFTAGMPVEWVMDESRTPMIAVGMNDEPLPRVHGYPARLIIPGLYGYVSATKWLAELHLTRFDEFEAFWIPRGWAAQAPILTQTRIDLPRSGASVAAGRVPVAGVAWAPDRGISKVEVRVDDGDWAPAKLSTPISKATWVQWLYDWNATPGSHSIEVRSTDGTGAVQTEDISPPPPDGARGHMTVLVAVS